MAKKRKKKAQNNVISIPVKRALNFEVSVSAESSQENLNHRHSPTKKSIKIKMFADPSTSSLVSNKNTKIQTDPPLDDLDCSSCSSNVKKNKTHCGKCLLVLFWILTFIYAYINWPIYFEERDGELFVHWSDYKDIYLLGLFFTILASAGMGLTCCLLTWTVTYYDSLQPGKIPPTPLSPRKYRTQSGHTFHLGYLMALLNGTALFCYVLWRASDYYLVEPCEPCENPSHS